MIVMSNEIDVSLDGTDPDCPENQQRERVPVSWQVRQMAADYSELSKMSEADLRHYRGDQRRK